jgi:cobalamin biosynthesis protein CobW
MTSHLQKIPATIITGFLGAGKTTLVRNILATANGKRIALIINEFGDLGIDSEVLKGCGDETCSEDDIVELANGCICCTVADDFIPTITKLMEREERPDHIVIETSGLALPQPLVRAFNWPEIRNQVTVDGVVTVVDSAAVADGKFASDHDAVQAQREADEALDHDSPLEELFEDQLNCADMIILNKTDLLTADNLERINTDIRANIRSSVKILHAHNGSLGADILLGLGIGAEDDLDNRKSHHELEGLEDHDHDDFESFVVTLREIDEQKALLNRLDTALKDHDILRLKGFAAIRGKPMRLVIQAVGLRVQTYFDREWNANEIRSTQLVVIGEKGLDRSAIESALKG